MGTFVKHGWKPVHSILFASTACLCLGVGMVVWGVAPAVIQRMITGRGPSLDTIELSALVFAMGGAFIGMHVLVRRCVRWAVWAAFLLSALLAATGLALTTLTGIRLTSSFLILLSAWTCFATWLAIATLARGLVQPPANPATAGDRFGRGPK